MITRKSIFSTSEAAFAVDQNGQIVIWNEGAERAFGYLEPEALDQQCWELLSGRDIFGNQSCCEGCPILAMAFDNKPVNRFQIDFRTAAHELKRFTVSMLMLFDGPGKEELVHLCFPELDITENAVTRLKVLASRGRRLNQRELRVCDLVYNVDTLDVTRTGTEIYLNPIGLKLLHRLMESSPNVVSRAELETEVWGDEMPDSDSLRVHIHSLRGAIDKPFGTNMIQTRHGIGYRLVESDAISSQA